LRTESSGSFNGRHDTPSLTGVAQALNVPQSCQLISSSTQDDMKRVAQLSPSSMLVPSEHQFLFSEEFTGDADAFFRACADHQLEGIVSKLASSKYRSGRSKTCNRVLHASPTAFWHSPDLSLGGGLRGSLFGLGITLPFSPSG